MKAAILIKTVDTVVFPFANHYPTAAFPIANEPLIKHNLEFLKKNNIVEVAIVLPEHLQRDNFLIKQLKNDSPDGMKISWFEEKTTKGTAGSLKELAEFIDSSPFLVISSNMFIEDFDLSRISNFHLRRKAGITVVVERDNNGKDHLENIEIEENGKVKKIHSLHHSKDNRRLSKPSGLYVFDPSALDAIFEIGYMDIKEQLIPRLNNRNIPTYAYVIDGPVRKINNFKDYFRFNKDFILNGANGKNGINHSDSENINQVWVGKNAKISPKAFIVGPVIIGDDCTIEDYSQVIGPTTIGRGSHIKSNVLVRESIIWDNARLGNKSRVEYSIIGDGCTIADSKVVTNSIKIQNNSPLRNLNFAFINNNGDYKVTTAKNGRLAPVFYKLLEYKFSLAAKRLLDLVCSFVGLLFSLPLFMIIAPVIKLDSSGPVFFSQIRCGKDGKEFKMYKFRTMVEDAEKAQKHLIDRKDVDGPMFKMRNDPRITGVGRFLRTTSLDELPQLINVIKGEMSLVGPRPLVMDEMKFAPAWRDIRLMAKPGITGMWQINGRSDISFHDWIYQDITYVENQSLKLDLKILIRTLGAVLNGLGAK